MLKIARNGKIFVLVSIFVDLRNHCNIFWVDGGIHSKNGGKTASCALLNANFDFDVSVANDVAIDVAKCALPGKVMQWSPCPEVHTLTNENGRYIMKLNDILV